MRDNLKTDQDNFDKRHRFYKRRSKQQQFSELENAANFNQPEMWAKLKKLNNPPSSKRTMEIIREDKTISRDIQEVLQKWHSDISNLFSGLRDNLDFAFDEHFFQDIINKKNEFENLCPNDQQNSTEYNSDALNCELLYSEVSKAIDNAKTGKSYLTIPNEAMKNVNAKLLLYKFFSLCFNSGINPTEWDNNDIIPIPKKDQEARDPLQNRCITIMC